MAALRACARHHPWRSTPLTFPLAIRATRSRAPDVPVHDERKSHGKRNHLRAARGRLLLGYAARGIQPGPDSSRMEGSDGLRSIRLRVELDAVRERLQRARD